MYLDILYLCVNQPECIAIKLARLNAPMMSKLSLFPLSPASLAKKRKKKKLLQTTTFSAKEKISGTYAAVSLQETLEGLLRYARSGLLSYSNISASKFLHWH